MPYAEGRTYHDADSHVMETPDWLFAFADPEIRPKLQPLALQGVPEAKRDRFIQKLREQHADQSYRAQLETELMLRKNWSALGSFLKEDRSQALDLLGFSSQLVFNTFLSSELLAAEHGDDLDYAYDLSRAHNRSLVDFCKSDPRLLATCYVPLCDFGRARAMAAEAITMGARALLVASACPKRHSPSHIGLDPVWAQAEEAGIPIVLHVGGGGRLLSPARAATERVRHAPSPRHAVPERRRGLADRASRRRSVSVLERLPSRRGRPQSVEALRRKPRSVYRRAKQRFYADNFVDLMGNGLRELK